MAHDPETLEPVWGWGAVGGPSSALAISPEGDRAYQSLFLEEEGAAFLLVRDLQTGRVLRTADIPEPAHAVLVDSRGDLLLAGWREGGAGAVTRMRWLDGELQIDWRRPLSDFDLSPPVRLAASESGRSALLHALNDEAGFRLIEVETGQIIGRLRGSFLDVASGDGDRIYLLQEGVIRMTE